MPMPRMILTENICHCCGATIYRRWQHMYWGYSPMAECETLTWKGKLKSKFYNLFDQIFEAWYD